MYSDRVFRRNMMNGIFFVKFYRGMSGRFVHLVGDGGQVISTISPLLDGVSIIGQTSGRFFSEGLVWVSCW